MHYRMVGSDEHQASRMVKEALVGKPPEVASKVIERVIDAAYKSEMDMDKLKGILHGFGN